MGRNHLVCEKCKVAYDLKKGSVFWIGEFIRCHWHIKGRRPTRGCYFQKSSRDLPKHLIVRNRIPHGYISTSRPAYGCKDGPSFENKDLLFEIRLNEAYWTWWRKLSLFLKSLWWAATGDHYKSLFEKGPFIVDKDNPEHDWIRSFNGDFSHQD